MQTTKQISKRILSLMLSALMVVTMLPTFVFSSPTTAEAQDTMGNSAYWQIMASTDFTKTANEWGGSGDEYTTSGVDDTTSAGGATMRWGLKYSGRNGVNGAEVSSKGVSIPWESDNHKANGMLYLAGYNGQTTDTIFTGVENFKIDLAFSFIGQAKCNTGYNLDGTRNDVPLLKLAKDSSNKYNHRSQYNRQTNYFIQTAWGLRSVDDDDFDVAGDSGSSVNGGKYAITTTDNNASSVINTNQTYHYVVYVADKMLGSYVTDDSGNVVINYNPIEIGSYNMDPSIISSIYLGASEFNWAGHYDIENIAYKSVEVYKGVDTHTYDSSRDKFLYAYFTGNDKAGETMHYAISNADVNSEDVN